MDQELSDQVILPIGYESKGRRYRKVIIDELSGVDEHLIANKKKTGGNTAKGLTLVLARTIQEIEEIVPRKKNSYGLIDYMIPRKMYQVDRDFLFTRVQLLAEKDEITLKGTCNRCNEVIEVDSKISEREVKHWPEDKPAQFEFTLPGGYVEPKSRKVHKEGILRFPMGSDQEQIAMIARQNQAQAMTAMLAACIKKLGDLPNIDQDIVSRFKSRDRRYLFNLIRDESPGLAIWEFANCYNCGNDKVEVTMDLNSFFG